MTLSIEHSLLSPTVLIRKCIQFTDNRPLLKQNNTGVKLRTLAGREFDELIEALERSDIRDDRWIVEVAEELPDVLIFILQHWLFEFRSHEAIAQMLFESESLASLLPQYTREVYGQKLQALRPELSKEVPLDDAICLRALTLCFAVSHSLDFDLYELASLKSDHNDKRYDKRLYDGKRYSYDRARKITKRYASRFLPKEEHLYPQLLELRRTRE